VVAVALALGVPGLVVGMRRNPAALALLVPIATIPATALIDYSASRFRLPMVPALLLGIGALAATLEQLAKAREALETRAEPESVR
jgi:hypothetical protein